MHDDPHGFAGANLASAVPAVELEVQLRAGATTRPGGRTRRRRANQDAVHVDVERGLYVLADGLGGHPRGEMASRLAIDELPVLLRPLSHVPTRRRQAILDALADATRRLSHRVHAVDPRMGSTVVVAYVRGSHLFTAHLGDSRIYRLRQGQLTALTRDHSVVQVMVDAGAIDVLTAQMHPERHHLTRFVGMSPVDVEVQSYRLCPDDRLLLCSDGVHGVLPQACLERILCAHRCPMATAESILDTVEARGGRDDASCIVVDP